MRSRPRRSLTDRQDITEKSRSPKLDAALIVIALFSISSLWWMSSILKMISNIYI